MSNLQGVVLLKPIIHRDDRGYFLECYREQQLRSRGITSHFVQCNCSFSKQGTIRGLHYQSPPHAQAKLVHVAQGSIWDVVVDLRQDMETFGKWQGFLLDGEHHHQLFIPQGFAHGFIVMSQTARVVYQCDNYHHPSAQRGIHFQDPTLNIPWERYTKAPATISDQDQSWPFFQNAAYF